MGFFFWKKKQEPQSTEGEISPPPSDSSLNPSPENKDRKTQKAERYFNKGLEFLNSTSYKDRALQQFINAGNLGYIDAIHYIGLCYFKGYGTPSNPERAVEIWQKNVLKKNPLTQYMLGYCYFHGIGIERNRIVARAYLKTAEALGNTDASILLKEDIPSQASSASSAPTHEPGFLKITVRDDKYDIQYENARANVCKQSEGYLFSEKSTIKQNSRYDSQEVIKRRKRWEFARLLVPQEPDLLVLWVNQNSRLTSISQVVEFISGKKVTGIPDDATLHRLQVWTNKDNKTETARKQEMVQKSDDKASETTPIRTEIEKSGEKITKTVLPAKYAEYSNVRDEYARSIFFLIEAFISDSPLKEQYFQAGREGIVRLSESGHAGAKELLYSLLYDERQKFRNQDTDIQTTRDILNSISPESRYMIFFTGANCGGIRAKIELGKCYRDGVGVIVDTKKAEFWFSTAAQSGSVEAKTLLNNLHLSAAVQPEPPKLDSSFVLFKEADMLYKRAIAYYVGDINGKRDSKNFQDYLELAIQFGSEQAKFLLNTDEKYYYTHLEAARYGSAEAKRYMQQGEVRRRLIGRIPGDILRQYFNFIDSNETSTYYYRTGHVPSQKYVEELYHLGLSYLVGDVTGRKNVSKSDACLQIAKDSGSQDAKFILDSPCKERYIYLEAAKYGSERAKRKVIELNQKGEFNGSIPDEKLKEYFQEIGLTITKFKSVTDSDAEKKSSSGKKSEKIIIDYSSANPAPKEKLPKSTPKKPKKQEKIVIDKERLQEVKAEHLYIQNRLAIDYGDDEPSVVPVSVPLTPETPAKAEAGGEWEQMRRALSKTHIQIISALLEEPGNITKQHDIAKSGGTMLDILYDEINEISDEILGDLLIDEGELVEEYIEDVKSLCQ